MGIFQANMYLAEDRILCFELVAKQGDRWVLKCVLSVTTPLGARNLHEWHSIAMSNLARPKRMFLNLLLNLLANEDGGLTGK